MALAAAASAVAGLFSRGRNHPGRQTPPTHLIPFNHRFKMIARWNHVGRRGGTTRLCSVRGTAWPERRCKPRGFPFPLGLEAEAPDVAALGRQRRFNPRPGIHVSRAPLLLKAPTQGQPWVCIGGGDPGGVEAGTRDHVHWAGWGLNQVTQCTRLESISGIQPLREGEEVEVK